MSCQFRAALFEEWFQNVLNRLMAWFLVLELCCFRMVQNNPAMIIYRLSFRAVLLFRMVQNGLKGYITFTSFRAVCCFEWFQNAEMPYPLPKVSRSCCFEWFQNWVSYSKHSPKALEPCCFEWFQNRSKEPHISNKSDSWKESLIFSFVWFRFSRL